MEVPLRCSDWLKWESVLFEHGLNNLAFMTYWDSTIWYKNWWYTFSLQFTVDGEILRQNLKWFFKSDLKSIKSN